MISLMLTALVALNSLVRADQAFQHFGMYTDVDCTIPFDASQHGGINSWQQWPELDTDEVETATTNTGAPPCVNPPFKGISSGKYSCIQTHQGGDKWIYTVSMNEWFFISKDCPSLLPPASQMMYAISNGTEAPQSCIKADWFVGLIPFSLYTQVVCGGQN